MADLDPTSEYARRVLDGEIVAGKFVKLACERHFSDLESGSDRGLYFDEASAKEAIDFFPAMFTISDGPKAGQPFELLDWHKFVVGSLFGWKRDGRLRFRNLWIETGKGQAKSPLMGGIALYVCGFMGIPRAQCYAIASKLDQAKIPFKDGVALVRGEIPGRKESLESRGDVFVSGKGENAWRIEFVGSKSFFEAKATTDSLSGPRPDCVIADEVHEFASAKPIELWAAGIAKKSGSAFMVLGTNTPALDQQVGTDQSEYYQRMLEGIFDDDEAFAYIARVDEDDDPFSDESCWVKALPALGVTFSHDNVRGEVNRAKNDAGKRLAVSRLYFGIPVGSSGFWVDEGAWRSCLGDVSDEDVEGLPCFLSLDLSEKNDLTALGAVWKDGADNLKARAWYWTTPAGLERRSALDRIPYSAYVEAGELEVTQSAVVDYEFVAHRIKDLVARYDVDSLTIDPSFWEKFRDACDRVGLAVWVYDGLTPQLERG